MDKPRKLSELEENIINCNICPRLVSWREKVAYQKRKAFMDWDYWGKPVPGFGDPNSRVMAIGLAPGAHGSNRTGRMFTGDASGDFLYPALYTAGFANQANAYSLNDGLILHDLFISAVCRCVPPSNKPSKIEMVSCQPFLEKEIALIQPHVIVVFGRIAYERFNRMLLQKQQQMIFKHGSVYSLNGKQTLVCSYHPSRQNTQTGRLTVEMFGQIWSTVTEIIKTL